MRTFLTALATLALATLTSTADAKPRARQRRADAIAAATHALALARLDARVSKARTKAAKALQDCAQAITDRCVERAEAEPNGLDCDVDEGLRAEYLATCLGTPEGK